MHRNAKWYKGITHSHSDLSDGNSAPEFITQWYKDKGYNFLAISDHNMFDSGLFEHLGKIYDESDSFLMLSGEEMTMNIHGRDLHMNILNIAHPIEPVIENNITNTIKMNMSKVQRQAQDLERKVLVHINHPDWNDYVISPEEIAHASDIRFMEIANCLGSVNHYGNSFEGGMEKYWDVVNTIRMAEMNNPPIYGMASDDAHDYEQFDSALANPGRGWMMVRGGHLSPESLINSFERGDFYCSTGINLKHVDFDPLTGFLYIEIQPENGVSYTIDFIGTPRGINAIRNSDDTYSADIGKVFQSTGGTSARYTLLEKDLYVRAHIRSSKSIPQPFWGRGQREEAWTQPCKGRES